MLSGTGHDSNASHELTAERMISGTPADVPKRSKLSAIYSFLVLLS